MNFSAKRLYAQFTVKKTKWLATIIVPFSFFVRDIWCRHKANDKVTSQTILYRLWRHTLLQSLHREITIEKKKFLFHFTKCIGDKKKWSMPLCKTWIIHTYPINFANVYLFDISNRFTLPDIHLIVISENKTEVNISKYCDWTNLYEC